MFPTTPALTWRWLLVSLAFFAAAAAVQWHYQGHFVVPAGFWKMRPWQPGHLDERRLGLLEDNLRVGRGGALALTTDDAVREIVSQGSLPNEWVDPVVAAIHDEARDYGVDPFLALAIMTVESHFNPNATSERGARGLMQLMPDTQGWLLQLAPELEAHAELDPELNVRLGMRYFARLQRSFGRVDRALQAYNCGPRRLSAVLHDEAALPYQTEVYAQRVLRRYQRLKHEYAYLSRS